jgi:predicted deacylase
MRVVLVAATAVLAAAGCGAGEPALSPPESTTTEGETSRPRMHDANYDTIVPFESLGDWVSYGDAVVVATVSAERLSRLFAQRDSRVMSR